MPVTDALCAHLYYISNIIAYIIIYIVFSAGVHYKRCVGNNMPPLRLIILHNHYCRQSYIIFQIRTSTTSTVSSPRSLHTPSQQTIIHLHGPRLFDIHRHRSVYHTIYLHIVLYICIYT